MQSVGSSLLSEQSGTPLQYFDNGIQIPFGHFNSDNLHVCFVLVTILLLFVLLPTLLLLDRLLLPLIGIRSFDCLSSAIDGIGGDIASGCEDVNDDDDDDDGNDNAYNVIGFETNVSKPMSAYSSADINLCPSIRNCFGRKEKKWIG